MGQQPNFGQETVGIASSPLVAMLTNTSDAALTITSIEVTGADASDFTETNDCGTSVPAGGSCTITVTLTPSLTGFRTASVSIMDDAPVSPQTLTLSGTGVAPGVMLSANHLTFPDQTANTTSPPQPVKLTNTGKGILTVGSIAVTGPFALTNTCGTVSPGASCTIGVTFSPSTTGSFTGSISISDNAPSGSQTVSLAGTGVLPSVMLAPTSLTYPDQTIYTTSPAQSVRLTNTGRGVLIGASFTVAGPFAQTNNCGASVNPGASCTISVTFTPKAKGTLNGLISVSDNAPASPQMLALTGFGTYVKLSPPSLSWGTQPVGTSSLPKKITLGNKGGTAVNITGISITGADPADFTQTNTCGNSVAAGATCSITVTFTPTAKGQRTAEVSVSDDGGGSPQTAPLSGTGT